MWNFVMFKHEIRFFNFFEKSEKNLQTDFLSLLECFSFHLRSKPRQRRMCMNLCKCSPVLAGLIIFSVTFVVNSVMFVSNVL